MSNPSINKRQKEKGRQDKAKEKASKRQERRDEKATRPEGMSAQDEEIAKIIPGPQPLPDGW